MLRIELLGPPQVSLAGVPVRFDTRKAIALLAVLAVEPGRQPRDRLAALLWPDGDEVRARAALRRTLSVTASAVGAALAVDRSTVGLDAAAAWTDVAEFAAAAGADPVTARRAVASYRGDFLAGFALRDAPDFDAWQAEVADRFRRQLANMLAVLVDDAVAAGDLATARADAERWLGLDPLHEPAHRALIRIHAWDGDRSAAMQQFRSCVRILDEELGVPPVAETLRLYEAVRRGALPQPARVDRAPAAQPPPSAPPLVGRDDAVAGLTAVAVKGGVGVITGAAGMGKTALLQRVVERVSTGTASALVRCHPEETSLAYGVAIDVLRSLVAARPNAMRDVGAHVHAQLTRLLPELGPRPGDDEAASTAQLYAAVCDLVHAAEPVVLAVDDAQWLDVSSAELFAYLVRRIGDNRLTMLASWADDVPPGPLFRAAMDAIADGRGTRQRLTALNRDDVTALVSTLAVDVDVDKLLRDTAGVPGLVTAYVEAVRGGADATLGAVGMRALLEARLAAATETTQQVLAAAAVAGRADEDLLRDASGRTETEVVAAIEQALRSGLLVELGAAGYDVSVEPLRALLLDNLTAARRRLLHQRTAAALERRAGARMTSAVAALIARHLEAAGRQADAADWHWRAAVEAAALHAREEALEEVRASIELGHAAASGRLLEGELLIALGRYRDAIDALELAAAGQSAADELAAIDRLLGDVHHRLGDFDIADGHLDNAIHLLDDGESTPAIAELRAERALLAHRRGESEVAADRIQTALAEAAAADDAGALAYTENVAGLLAAGERADDAEVLFRRSVEHATAAESPSRAVAALNNLARLLHQQGRIDDALTAADEALRQGQTFGDVHRVAALHANRADLLRAAGRDDEAMAELKEAAALFADVDEPAQRRPEIWTLVEW